MTKLVAQPDETRKRTTKTGIWRTKQGARSDATAYFQFLQSVESADISEQKRLETPVE
jgi:hypothetical protein